MYFVIFELKSPTSRTSISTEYYLALQKILQTQQGFISEIPYASPHHEDRQVLVARFADEASVRHWRGQHDHLKFQYKSREALFDDYRLRVGPETSSDDEAGADEEHATGKKGRFVCLYERPAGSEATALPLSNNVIDLVDSSAKDQSADISALLVDTTVYQGEKDVVWISSWVDKAASVRFEQSIARTHGDAVHFIQVVRDYGKYDRKEAPEDADAAQAASVSKDGEAAKDIPIQQT